jgi:hypothetical protein
MFVGHVDDTRSVNHIAARCRTAHYIKEKHALAASLAEDVTGAFGSRTALPGFDLYCKQSFLDNVLRGGHPMVFPSMGRPHVYYTYGRQHGDLERDYNDFLVAPEYYAQGNGAYRDVNQNRRNDVLIEPSIGDQTVAFFMNLIQTDGYNPLEIHPTTFTLDAKAAETVRGLVEVDEELMSLLATSFTPGRILRYIERAGLRLKVGRAEFVAALLYHASEEAHAEFGRGYWIDHWTYNLDLIDSYLTVFPDRKEEFLFDREIYTFYDSAVIVPPRCEKHVLVDGRVQQLHALAVDPEKKALIENRERLPNVMRQSRGTGDVYKTTLFAKLLALGAIKFATLDPLGMGVEMEADRPGWYDPLNGLPALFGSSLSETYELSRLLAFLEDALLEHPTRRLHVAREVWDLSKTRS